jgi:hypothetical protein
MFCTFIFSLMFPRNVLSKRKELASNVHTFNTYERMGKCGEIL